jgi:hypothetical protein
LNKTRGQLARLQILRSAAVSQTSRSSLNTLRLTLRAQPRSAKSNLPIINHPSTLPQAFEFL